MSSINKIKLPNGTTYDVNDVRIPGIDSTPTNNSQNVVTSTGIYNNRVGATIVPDADVPEEVETKAMQVKMEYLDSMLAKSPEIVKRGSSIYFYHPLIHYPGAELILVRYRKCNKGLRKGVWKYEFGEKKDKKKGWCVSSNRYGNTYFNIPDTFPDEDYRYSEITDIQYFFNSNHIEYASGQFGFAVRIINPNYTGPSTSLKNATYQGQRECIFSDIKKVRFYRAEGDIGISINM